MFPKYYHTGGKYMTHLFSKLALAVLALAVAATVFRLLTIRICYVLHM